MHESESRLEDARWNDRLDAMVDELSAEAETRHPQSDADWDAAAERMADELAHDAMGHGGN